MYTSTSERDTAKILDMMFPSDYKGVYVDVGAGYPKYRSNSYHFRKKGWRVIAIEPQPKMCALYRGRGYEILEYACAATDIGETDFEVVDRMHGLGSALKIIEAYWQHSGEITTIRVQALKLDTLLEQFYPDLEKIDILDIDVERYELDVLRGFSADIYKPTVVVIENHRNSEGWVNPNEELLRQHYGEMGYEIIGSASWNEFIAPVGSLLAGRARMSRDFMDGFNEPRDEATVQSRIWENFRAHDLQWGGMQHDPHDHHDALYSIPYVAAGLELYQRHVLDDVRSILEIGCAQGYILNHVGPPDAKRVGIDFNEDRIRKGREQYPDTIFIVGDARQPRDIEGAPFDVVLLPGIIEHVRFQEARALVQTALDLCKPGGKVLFDLPWWDGDNFNHGIHQNPAHAWTCTPYRWDWLFRGLDAKRIHLPDCSFYVFGIIERSSA